MFCVFVWNLRRMETGRKNSILIILSMEFSKIAIKVKLEDRSGGSLFIAIKIKNLK